MATGAYLQWIAPQLDDLADRLPASFEALRAEFQGIGSHARQSDQLAHLLIGLQVFFNFAVEIGAVERAQADERLAACRAAMVAVATARATDPSEETAIGLFLRFLSDGFGSRRIYVETTGRTGSPPESASEWGWLAIKQVEIGEQHLDYRHPPAGRAIGLLDDQYVYLLPDELQVFLNESAARMGIAFPNDARSLREELANAGLIKTESERRRGGVVRRTTVKVPGGPEKRFVALRRISGAGVSLTGVGLVGLLGSAEGSVPGNPTDPTDRKG
jgi:hypothetical protein